jgi:hypothetical protein
MLIEVDAREVEPRENLELLDPTDPLTEKYRLRLDEGRTHMEFYGGVSGEYRYIVKREGAGTCRVWRRPPTTVQWLEASLARTGMRLPNCDEWERACGAGASTLFRWGDNSPDDYYPTDTCAEDRELSRAWVLSLGTLVYERPPPTWTLHLQQNLFGLRIAHDPYKLDLVSDGPGALGGDGGCNICGGAGFFLGWLPLATAYANPDCAVTSTTEENIADEHHRVRRVIPLA